jgi:tRNA (mo5U34)-methyltransferase
MPDTPISAGDPAFEARIQQLSGQVQARFRYHSIELPDGSVLPGLQSLEHLRWRLGLFGLPADLRGKRVLDIGAWDGWFSFECERRGAEVVAVDCVALDTFLEAKQLIGSKVEYLTLDVEELSARRLGRFDIVLFFGVLYHLRHPLLGLERVVELCTDIALIESFVISPETRAIPAVMEYYERGELGGQIDNWCGPSPECLVSFCRSAGFARAQLLDVTNNRGSVICHRRWPEPPIHATAAPELRSAVNNRSWEPKFHPHKDEYLCCFFRSSESQITPDTLFVEVDGFGTQTLAAAPDGSGGWQANCLRPPGLEPGPHEVRVRTLSTARSNGVAFTMLDEWGRDPAESRALPPVAAPELCSAEFRASGDLRLAGSGGGALICYFRAPTDSVAPRDVLIESGGQVVQAGSVSSLGPGVWQANVNLSLRLADGTPVRVRLGDGEWSEAKPAVTAA